MLDAFIDHSQICFKKFELIETRNLYFQEDEATPFCYCHLDKSQYVGQLKGMKQILRERGFGKERMARDGKRRRQGVIMIDINFSMEEVLNACNDFKESLRDFNLAQLYAIEDTGVTSVL